ncbi:hypothetical protein [Larkinella terrae]|uniref:T9SS type A sorting domain-containing protein n=1 Tax=Larkinella terrae TaxID=2025311 RepID=A0A7K0EMA5_9BACT|nr:hypothetical protein [Larkinella terrae]MRS62616.1 hypothetical protein [Larkinella terrae]
MKTIFRILYACLLPAGSVLAQDVAYYENSKPNPSGYWEVSTDYRTSGTAIRYYNPEQQLMHQEVLPNKLVKLTKRNVRRLNAALTSISLQKKEPSNVKTVALPTDNEDARVARTRRKMMHAERLASSEGISARVVPTSDGDNAILKLFIYNPHEERLRIDILTAKGNTVCQEFSKNFQQYHRFNLSYMPSGDYRVKIYRIPDKAPTVNSLLTLSRKPSESFFSMRPLAPTATNGDSLASDQK